MSRRGNWYVPVALVTAVSGCSSLGPLSVTVTPGSTPPDESVTLPKISPVWLCALAIALVANSATSARTITLNLIRPPQKQITMEQVPKARGV